MTGRRRALVDVGRPEVERHGGDLEAEPDEEQGDAGEHEGVVALDGDAAGQRGDHLGDVGGPDGAVHEGDAVQQERRGEAAEDEVLDAALGAAGLAAVARGEDVERQRHRLQPDEQHDQVVRRRHHDAARRGDEQQGVDLRTVERLAPEVVVARHGDEDQRGADGDRHEQGERVERQRLADERRRAVVRDVVPQDDRQHTGRTGGHGGDEGIEAARPERGQGADDEQEQRRADEHDHRREGEPVDVGSGEGLGEHQPPSPSSSSTCSSGGAGTGTTSPVRTSTCSMRRSTLGSMRSMSGFG